MRFKHLHAFVFFLLAIPTSARTTNDPPISSHVGTGAEIRDEELPKREKTKDVEEPNCETADKGRVKFVPIEEANLTNVFRNGVVENNIASRNSARVETAKIGTKFVRMPTIDSETSSRNFHPYRDNSDNVSKILLYPVNGTTIVYRETTFGPIVPDGVMESGNGYLPLSTWSKVNPEATGAEGQNADGEEPQSRDEEVIEAANFGLEAMNDLYYIKEPKLFSMGLFLADDNPARFVAAFNGQTDEARQLARFGFAALEGARLLVSKHPEISRSETFVRDVRQTALSRQCPRRGVPPCPPASLRYRTTDGSCNNLKEPWWGSAMSAMQRFLQPVYQDGIQTIRRSVNGRLLPSPRELSATIHQDHDIPLASVTHMLMQWGQFVDHDLTATGQSRGFNGTTPQCCLNGGASFQPPEFMHPECLPIPVPVSDKFYGPLGLRCLEFVRSGAAPREDCGFGPREQLTQVTSYLDASTVYSSNVQLSDSLRLFRNGLLQYGRIQSRKPLLPRQENDLCRRGSLATSCFRAGDGRLSEQPGLISLHVIFLRQHNRIATELAALNQHWSDEKLFQETRRIVSALVQQITYREFLPIVLGPEVIQAFDLEVKRKGYYDGYDPTVNPNIANSFAAAAYRFGHSLVQHSFVRYDTKHRPIFNNVTIHDEFNNPVNLHTAGSVDRLLLGLINQPSQKRDEFISEELTNHLFQTSNIPFGLDLASLNIQRGRDHGIPPYVEWREPCGLSPITKWEDLDRVMFSTSSRKFRSLYSSVQDVDLFPAGLAEKPVPGGLVGPTFACIIAQQFSNLRKGDRFWYENPNRESSFTAAQLQQLKRVSLAQILCKTAESIETIQPFVFLTADTFRNERISCDSEIIGTLDLSPWAERAPPEQRTKSRPRIRRKGHVKKRKNGTGQSSEKSFFPFFKPVKTGINQQNKVVIRRPSDTHENLTILVQNHAVNSPVFVSDSIKGSNFQFTQANDPPKAPSHRPTVYQDPYTPRPIYYDDTPHNPVSVPQTSRRPATEPPSYGNPSSYRPVSKPSSYGDPPSYRPGSKPSSYGNPPSYRPVSKPSSYGNSPSYQGPYIPQAINDPSNPNPPNYGYVSRPMNNYAAGESFSDDFATSTTTQRPTLYTYYTTFKRPSSTQRPSVYHYEPNRPQTHQHDSPSSWPAANHGQSYPAKPQTSGSRPSYDQSWTQEGSYGQNWESVSVQADTGEWDDSPYGKPGNGYWTEFTSTTKKYPSSYYHDDEYQIHNAAENINPRPFKKQSVTILTDSDTDVHYPQSVNKRVPTPTKNEVPRPLLPQGLRDRDEAAEHKDHYQIDLDQIIDKRTRPGQFYYEKNVLHRYPDEDSDKESNGALKNKEHGTADEVIDRIVIDPKYQIERRDPNRGGPGPSKDTDTNAQVATDEIKLTTTATVVLDDEDDEDDDEYDSDEYDDEEEEEEEEISGAYSENEEHVLAPDAVISPIEWITVNENSSLKLNPDMPSLGADELVDTKEIPTPLKLRKPGS